jgi:hypothetical protein
MRPFMAGFGLVALLLPGCVTQWLNPRPPADRGIPVESLTADRIVASLNDNAHRIQSLRSDNMDITTTVGLQSFHTPGKMVFQKPRNFRLNATAIGNQVADIGSNDQEFWWWISKDDPPYLYHVTHTDFANSQGQIRLPFQPDWMIEALGVGEYDPQKQYQLTKGNGNTLQLEEMARAPDGRMVRKQTILSRTPQNRITVSAHRVLDERNQPLFTAQVTEVQRDQRTDAVLPKVVELHWPAQKMRMTLRLSDVTVNPALPAPGTSQLFARPNLVGVRSFDLAKGADAPNGSLQRAGGVYRQ